MLNEKMLKEAQNNFRTYLETGLVKKVRNQQNSIIKIFLKNAQESIDMAQMSNKNNISGMWTIVCSYYSMFYVSNALLYVYGYKIGDKIAHKVTSDCLIYLMRDKLKSQFLDIYIELEQDAENFAQIKSDTLIENLNFERKKRSTFQYETPENIKLSKSQTSLKRAKEFLFELRDLIEKKI